MVLLFLIFLIGIVVGTWSLEQLDYWNNTSDSLDKQGRTDLNFGGLSLNTPPLLVTYHDPTQKGDLQT